MAVGSEIPTWITAPSYRGQHAGRGRPRHGAAGYTQIALIGFAGVTVLLVTTAAVLPFSRNTTGLVSPLPARTSSLPLAPLPHAQSSGPPGVPAGTPGTQTPSPTQSSTAPRSTPAPSLTTSPTTSPNARPTVRPPVVPVSYEAEAASNVLRGATRIRAVPEASGGQVITSIGGCPANSLRFNNIDVPFAGTYTLAIRYVSAGDRTANISVNGTRSVSLRFPSTSDLESTGLLAVRIRLDLGGNSIDFSNPVANAPDIDQIIVAS